MRFLLVTMAVSLMAFINYGQADTGPADNIIESVYLAKADSNGGIGDLADEFNTTDIPIYCVVELNTDQPVTVKLNFIAVKVAGVRPGTVVVKTSYTTKNGETTVNFSGRPEKLWAAGHYRVEVSANGSEGQHLEFEIKRPQR